MQVTVFIGADVCKASIDVASADGRVQATTIPNDSKAIRRWLKTLPAGARIACESTGTYHRLLAKLAFAAGFIVHELNACDLSHYARSIGRRAKTDRLDADMLARFLAREHADLRPWQPPTARQQHIDDLIARRALLVKQRTALRQAAAAVDVVPTAMAQLIAQFGKTISGIDKELRHAVAQDEQLKVVARRLRAVPGIGALLAVAIGNMTMRTALGSADAAVAFVGLDPRTRDSGTFRGRKKLSKRGSPEMRRLLYNGAMAAARHPAVAPIFARLRERGLSPIAAYNALARRVLRAAWSLTRHGADFDMKRFVGA